MNISNIKNFSIIIIAVILVSFSTYSLVSGGGTSMSEDEINDIIREYIKNNPEDIIDSLTEYQSTEEQRRASKAQDVIKEKINILENDPKSPIMGNPEGDITIVEFFDYSCGYCKRVFPTLSRLAKEDKNLKIVFKEFPILGPNSVTLSKAAVAVFLIDPDKYVAFHTKLMDSRVAGKNGAIAIAKDLNIDAKSLEAKMESPEVAKIIADNRDLANDIGVRGTPAFVIAGEFIPGANSYEAFKEKIAEIRRKN
ncbi:DsbA family protein [Rickettsiales bacterium]|nr:DsbA family protein [Rickettsiales bacterium]